MEGIDLSNNIDGRLDLSYYTGRKDSSYSTGMPDSRSQRGNFLRIKVQFYREGCERLGNTLCRDSPNAGGRN